MIVKDKNENKQQNSESQETDNIDYNQKDIVTKENQPKKVFGTDCLVIKPLLKDNLMPLHFSTSKCYNSTNKNSSMNTPTPSLGQ
ncbi:hypothetical protein [Staphylococcus chromogenes]|uniref:hypothetical protein n=1 Tax=Staphylococcus chromogenes TaxID=46126 RepID=UPI0028851D1E|nr:hypothetical protein [Staphylococcus chromogenes]MDT0699130.1 hypothetical protein [Staphylococcus chromogenes]